MSIESNEEAMKLLDNVKGSIENKIRAAYNLGYKQGKEDDYGEVIYPIDEYMFVVACNRVHVIKKNKATVTIDRDPLMQIKRACYGEK